MSRLGTLSHPNKPHPKLWRLRVIQLGFALAFLLLIIRIYTIQLVDRQTYIAQADENRFDTVSIPATRGIIVDRNDKPLAVNVASANITVTPALLPDNEDNEMAVLERLSRLINVPLSGVLHTVDERGIPERSLLTMVREGQGIAPYNPVVVKRDVSEDTARIILADKGELPGVNVDWVSVRDYPTGALTSHIIGYMGRISGQYAQAYEAKGYVLDRDRIGYDGLEYYAEDELAGSWGLQRVVRDVAGQIVTTLGDPLLPKPGLSLRLTIDTDLQAAAQKALTDEINYLNTYYNKIVTERGVVIASNPKTGEILAMVSWPTYDNQHFARDMDSAYYLQVANDPLHPLFDQAVGSLYPPGSIFKVITLTGALEEGVVTPDQYIVDPGHIDLVNRYYKNDPGQSQRFVCWIERGTGGGHGKVDAVHALAWSCDVYFYKVGGGYTNPDTGYAEVPDIGLGITRLGWWMNLYGLGPQTTGIELPAEDNISNLAIIPSPDWKRRVWGENWSTGDTYNDAFGQGYVTVTPLQMLDVINAIANNGLRPKPTLIHDVLDADGHVVVPFKAEYVDMHQLLQDGWPGAHDGQAYPGTLDQTLHVVQEGMRAAVTIEGGTALEANLPYVTVAGKTGTAEYCDDIAAAADLCKPGNWPSHAWFMAYAPYTDPEISVVAFVYNGGEGALIALPVAKEVLDAYFKLKTQRALDQQTGQTPTP
jgi:penicillin-binding protein 2